MKLKFQVLAAVLLGSIALSSAANAAKPAKDELKFEYDIEYVKTVGDGVSTVKIFSYGKNKQEAWDRCGMVAVHGVIFKGYSGKGSYQAPIVRSANGYNDNKDFFDNFFKKGDYQRYISNITDGTQQIIKIKGGYKVGAEVNINVKMLRKHLEEAGIARGLASGF